jgi:hypothetical protein
MSNTPSVGSSPVEIISANDQGIGLDDGLRQWLAPWSTISQITVALVPHRAASLLVAAIGIDDERVVVAAEDQPLWPALMEALHRNLPDVEPMAIWETRARMGDGANVIYP